MGFTPNQTKAIETHGQNLLVSAAAGSGKTAVLVERIIEEITKENEPVNVDELLIMTFTKAAAGEMKDRIQKAIRERSAKNPRNRHLKRQSTLIHNAHISTIHGFCLEVIRNHFHAISLSPDFKPMEEAESRLLMQDALEEVLEEAYESGREDFLLMTEHICAGKNDASLMEIILKIYKFAISNPDVEAWFDKASCGYKDISEDNFDEHFMVVGFMKTYREMAKNHADNIRQALNVAKSTDGPYSYAEALEYDLEALEALQNASSYEAFSSVVASYAPANLKIPSKKGPYVDEELKEQVKKIRNTAKKYIKEKLSKAFALSKSDVVTILGESSNDVEELIKITRAFYYRFSEKKQQKNLIDFSDMEHFCLKILTSSDKIADEYRSHFKEIYVDEYQDSNLVQEAIVNAIARDNVFMVGDVKQSIYSFRMARPELFMEKYNSFASYEEAGENANGNGIRIDLYDNFRSRREVIESVNEVFGGIMHKEFGGIEYDENQALKYGATYYDDATDNGYDPMLYKSECILASFNSEIDPVALEARVIADKIRDLFSSEMKVYDKQINGMRPICYRDIVILLRTASASGEQLSRALTAEGIPVHVETTTGYFAAKEVSTLIDYLKILDNPLQDIPYAAVLLSPLGGYTEEELSIIRGEYEGGNLYDAMKHFCNVYPEDNLGKKVKTWINKLEIERDKAEYTSVYDLLREIIDGEYGEMVAAMPDGGKMMANLDMLLKRAREYGKTDYRGLFRFVRYIEYLKKNEIDYGEVSLIGENDDTVRIMSIHKSKGLEFPVCILSQIQKEFNFMDANSSIVLDVDYGIGINHVDRRRTKRSTLPKDVIASKIAANVRAEELRILYVAMTRAREKLIITGVVKKPDETLNKRPSVMNARSYLDFLLTALGPEKGEFVNILLSISDVIKLTDCTLTGEMTREQRYLGRLAMIKKTDENDVQTDPHRECGENSEKITGDTKTKLRERFNFIYPADESDNFVKVSVTELKKRSMKLKAAEAAKDGDDSIEAFDEPPIVPLVPAFLRETEEEYSPTLHGTAFHRMLELWDYSLGRDFASVCGYFDSVRDSMRMEEDFLKTIRPGEIADFLATNLATRMEGAFKRGELYREQPFVLKAEGQMLVQGIIDAFFIEDGAIVVVDYKTDKVKNKETLVQRYKVQLDYYEQALGALMNMPVKEKIIYSSYLKEVISV